MLESCLTLILIFTTNLLFGEGSYLEANADIREGFVRDRFLNLLYISYG